MWGVSDPKGSARVAEPSNKQPKVMILGALLAALATQACGAETETAEVSESQGAPAAHSAPTVPVGDLPQFSRVAVIEGFDLPESVRHHPSTDRYFVSNIGSHPTRLDNDGFISRVDPAGTVEELRFVAGGQDGVTLNAPKGMRILGDTLWVADVTVVRAFDVVTGDHLLDVDLGPAGAVFLNALDRGGDGAMYVTDSGLLFDDSGQDEHVGPDRVYRIDPSGEVTVALESNALESPNGIDWDERTGMFVLASRNGRSLWAWPLGNPEPLHLALGPAGYDGALSLPDGRVFASSWGAQDIQVLWSTGGLQPVITGLQQAADIGFDLGRDRLLVPLLGSGRVELWELN